jgi:Lon protease-like protein
LAVFVQLPIFPLHAVLFPGGVLPLRVFEARYMDMTRECLRKDRPFGVCLIREGREVGSPAVPEPLGCLARIAHWDMPQLGVLHLRTVGGERFCIRTSDTNAQNLVLAEVELLAPESDDPVPAQYAPWAALVRRAVETQSGELFCPPYRYESAAWLAYRLGEIVPLPLEAKQQLLQINDGLSRLAALERFIGGTLPAS